MSVQDSPSRTRPRTAALSLRTSPQSTIAAIIGRCGKAKLRLGQIVNTLARSQISRSLQSRMCQNPRFQPPGLWLCTVEIRP
jgi:hypothetical protein